MSYAKFTKALNDYYVQQDANHLPSLEVEEVEALVRDKWIQDGRYKELIAFILENWDSGNGDYFTRPLSAHLIGVKENALFTRLWKGQQPNITIDKIKQINTDKFNQFSSTETIERKVAWRRLYIIDGIEEFIAGLGILNETDEIKRQTELLNAVSNLEKPIAKPN